VCPIQFFAEEQSGGEYAENRRGIQEQRSSRRTYPLNTRVPPEGSQRSVDKTGKQQYDDRQWFKGARVAPVFIQQTTGEQ